LWLVCAAGAGAGAVALPDMPGIAAWVLLEHAVRTAPAAIADSARPIIFIFDIVFSSSLGVLVIRLGSAAGRPGAAMA
jgi:hypothetical protein